MKPLIVIFALSIAFTSCKKQNNTPSQQPTQNNTTPTIPTSTTTVNDTVGKIKIFYTLQIGRIAITGRDYKQDTTNVRIYHNGTQLRNHFVNIAPDGLCAIENGQFTGAHAEMPLWCNHGDSVVMIIDSLEINGTTSAQSERFLRIITKITKDASIGGTLISQLDTYQYGTYFGILEPYYTATKNTWNVLGTKINSTSGLSETWVIGGRFKLVYVIP